MALPHIIGGEPEAPKPFSDMVLPFIACAVEHTAIELSYVIECEAKPPELLKSHAILAPLRGV